jgi:hypothetical protein
MDEKRIQQNPQALREGFQSAKQPIDEMALQFARKVAQDHRFEKLANRPEQVAIASVVMGCLHAAKEYSTLPDEQWAQFLEQIKREAPYALRPGFRTGMKDMIKSFPKRPSTGRNTSFTEEEQKEACDLVSKYYRNGDSKRTAYQRVAAHLNCSARTIQRAWKKRAQLLAGRTKPIKPSRRKL